MLIPRAATLPNGADRFIKNISDIQKARKQATKAIQEACTSGQPRQSKPVSKKPRRIRGLPHSVELPCA